MLFCLISLHYVNGINKVMMMMTYEEEEVKQIPFLDALLVRREDGSVKLLVYRTKLHTDQYLNFSSHHPLNHKLAGIRTLLERCYSIVTEEHDQRRRKNTLLKRSVSVATLPGPSIGSNRISWRNL